MTPDIISIISGYYIFSTIFSVVRLLFVWRSFKKYQKEKPEFTEVIKHWKGVIKKWLGLMSGHTKMLMRIVCIPIGILLLIAPPVFFPFTIIIDIVSIPNEIKKRRKKKEDEILKTSYKLFDDAILRMNDFFEDDFKEVFKKKDEYTAVISEHHHAGMFLRNGLALWDTSRDLTRFFILNGIAHADEMSTILLRAFYRELNGMPFKTKDIIKEKFENPNPDSGYDAPVENAIQN